MSDTPDIPDGADTPEQPNAPDGAPGQPDSPSPHKDPTHALPTGIAVGCLGHIVALGLAVVVMIISQGAASSLPIALTGGIVPLVALGMTLRDATRRIGLGILIASAATWLIFLGPCISLTSP